MMKENEQELVELDLEDILKEFGGDEDTADLEVVDSPVLTEIPGGDEPSEEPAAEKTAPVEVEGAPVCDDTIRLDNLAQVAEEAASKKPDVTSNTIRLDLPVTEDQKAEEEEAEQETTEAEASAIVPPAPIVFDPRAKLRELKRKLVAGPEKRYYELTELGVIKLQIAILLCLIVVAVSAGAGVLYSLDMIPENRMRLMVFGQVFAMLLGALLGSYQMLEGLADLFRGKFTANTLLTCTFFACCADAYFCLQELRVPLCAAFTLEVMMSLWGTYHRRTTEMGMMDTMRKASRLHSVVKCAD